MNLSKLSKEEYMYRANLRINNSLNDEAVSTAVAGFGYTTEKLNEGLALLQATETLYEQQKKEYGDVDAAQAVFDTTKQEAHKTYMAFLTLARIAFKGDVRAQTTLDLNVRRAVTFSGWLKQALNFYHALQKNAEWISALGAYGVTTEKIQEGLTLLEEVAAKAEDVKKEKGDAQNATQVRDEKFEELNEWVNDYEEVARIALANSPQLLEKLGIVVKS